MSGRTPLRTVGAALLLGVAYVISVGTLAVFGASSVDFFGDPPLTIIIWVVILVIYGIIQWLRPEVRLPLKLQLVLFSAVLPALALGFSYRVWWRPEPLIGSDFEFIITIGVAGVGQYVAMLLVLFGQRLRAAPAHE